MADPAVQDQGRSAGRRQLDSQRRSGKADGSEIRFDVDEFRKHCLINGLDDIGLTMQHVDDIKAYEAKRKQQAPWLFN